MAPILLALAAGPTSGQEAGSTGLELGGFPIVKVDSDDGFDFGLSGAIYEYGDGTLAPYMWTLQPQVEIYTGGRRDITLFIDAPHLLPEGWRVNGFLGSERRLYSPYYGIGNEAPYDESLDDAEGPDPHYYEYGSVRRSALFNLQRRIPGTPLWGLFGAGLVTTRTDPTPDDEGTTLYREQLGPEVETYWSNYLRAGLVWDTRDRETGPTSGSWSEIVVHWVTRGLGADFDFTRWSVTDRRYYALTERLVFAHRYFLQGVSGDAPVHQLQRVQSSFLQNEGLGGSRTVRGLPKNRYAGKGMLVWNAELRLRAVEFGAFGRSFYIGLSAFVDQGRVWAGGPRVKELFSDLHRGYGGGIQGGMGENLLVSLDVAHSSEATLPFYIHLGYLF
jgi:hypothetical protein